MMPDRRTAVAQASVQLLGSILQFDVPANAINLAISLGQPQTKLQKRIQSRITKIANTRFSSLGRQDKDAIMDALTGMLKDLPVDQTVVRLSKDSKLLHEYILSRSKVSELPAFRDDVTSQCAISLLQMIASFIAVEVRNDPAYQQIHLDEAIGDIRELKRTIGSRDEQLIELRAAVDSVERASLIKAVTQASVMPPSLSGIVSYRPLPRSFVGRSAEVDKLAALMESSHVAWLSGTIMTGRFELARQWCLSNRPADHAWVVECSNPTSTLDAISTLAHRYGAPSSGDIAQGLRHVCEANPDITLILTRLPNQDIVSRIATGGPLLNGAIIAILDFPPQLIPIAGIEVSALPPQEVAGLIRTELLDDHEGLLDVAYLVDGQLLAARQAASFMNETGCSFSEFVGVLERRPHLVLKTAFGGLSATSAAIWDAAIAEVQAQTGRDAAAALAALRLLHGRAVEGAWQAALGCWLTAREDLGEHGEVLALRGALRRLQLVDTEAGVVSAPRLLLEYCWSTLETDHQVAVAAACLNATRLAAGHGRVSLSAGVVNAVAWLLWADFSALRQLGPSIFDETVLLAAAYLCDVDMPEHAQSLLSRLIEVQQSSGDADLGRASIALGHLLLEVQWPGASNYVQEIEDYCCDPTRSPLSQGPYNRLAAQSEWRNGDLQAGLRRAQESLDKLDTEGLGPDEYLMSKAQTHRLLGWFHVCLGNHDVGLAHLEAGLQCWQSDERFHHAEEEYRGHTVSFLIEQDVAVPSFLTEVVEPLGVEHADVGITLDNSMALARAYAAKSGGDLDKAIALLGSGPTFGFDDFYNGVSLASHNQRKAGLLLDQLWERIDGIGWVDGSSVDSGAWSELFREPLGLVNAAIEALDALSEDLQSIPRVKHLRSGLWVNRGAILRMTGGIDEAISLTMSALESDAEEFGEHHTEYANDALALGGCLLTARKVSEARFWLVRAEEIYEAPGPHRDLPKAAQVADMLSATSGRS